MTEPRHSDRLPFERPMPVAKLRTDAETRFRVAAEPAERTALAGFLGVDAVERLSLAGFIAPHGRDGWRVRGRLVAKIVQTCVVTLEPVKSRIETDVERVYVPAGQVPCHHDVVMLHDEEDAPDPYTESIDPAQLAVETVALLIDPYPRIQGAVLSPEELGVDEPTGVAAEPADGDTVRPFAGLAELIRRSESGRG